MRLSLQQNIDKIAKQVDRQILSKVNAVTARSLNRVATTVRKEASKEIRAKYNLKAGDVTQALYIFRAKAGRLFAMVTARGEPISLRKFGGRVKRVNTSHGRRKAVTVKILRKGGRKTYKGAFAPKSGVGAIKAGTVFIRTGNARLPIKKVNVKRLPKMFMEDQIQRASKKVIAPRFTQEFERQMQYEILKLERSLRRKIN